MATNPRAEQWKPISLAAVWEPPVVPEGKTFEAYQRDELMNGIWVEREDPLGRTPGEALWPEKYDAGDLALLREAVGPYDWEALFQQRPYSRSGTLFRREWFPVVEEPPKDAVARIRYWDKASTAGGGAYSCGVLMARTEGGLIVVESVSRGQWGAYDREEEVLRCARMDAQRPGPGAVTWHEQEPGSSGKDSAQATNNKLATAGFEAHFETVTGDKVTRARPWSSACEAGVVRLVRGGWNEAYVEEHLAFPMGRLRDQVDASDGAYSKLTGDLVLEGQLLF